MSNVFLRNFLSKTIFKPIAIKQLSKCCSTAIPKRISIPLHQQCSFTRNISLQRPIHGYLQQHARCFTTSGSNKENNEEAKPTLFQKFKKMYRDYWYVLVPVHLITSAGWFGGFYYLAISGVDIVGLLENWHVSESIIGKLRDSSMGYFAIAYACFKIATPARYTVTLGGTTVSINILKKWGYIKPVPSADRLKEIYHEGKENILVSVRDKQRDLKEKTQSIKSKIETIEKDIGGKMKQKKDDIKKNTPNLLKENPSESEK